MPQAQANGITIEYETFGRESDPVVLLIMGFAAQMTVWPESLCRGLAMKGFRVVRFDNRDVGKSAHLADLGVPNLGEAIALASQGKPVSAPYILDDMAADAVGLLDALAIPRAHIVGASMGGMIAQIVAARHGGKAKSLVSIMSTTGNPALPSGKPEAFAAITTPPKSPSREDRIEAGMFSWRTIGSPGFPRSEAELRAFVTQQVDRAPYDPAGIARQLVAVMASPPRNALLREVRCPALVVHGADDPLVPLEAGKDTAASIPGSELVVIPGMGHDIAEALVPILLEHLGRFVTQAERTSGSRG